MNIRTIKIASTALGLKTIESNAETFGELLPELKRLGIDPIKNTIIFEGNRAEITREDTLLPEGNFNLFSYPKEVKSGVDFDEMESNINDIYDHTHRLEDMEETIDKMSEKIDELIELIKSNSLQSTEFKRQDAAISEEDQRLLEEAQKLASIL